MHPSPCRFVLYCYRDRESKKLIERPALVTSVNSDKSVNLTVFFERYDEDECSRGVSGDLDCDPRRENVDENSDGQLLTATPQRNTWRWPLRV